MLIWRCLEERGSIARCSTGTGVEADFAAVTVPMCIRPHRHPEMTGWEYNTKGEEG
jgi:hypothetical protein